MNELPDITLNEALKMLAKNPGLIMYCDCENNFYIAKDLQTEYIDIAKILPFEINWFFNKRKDVKWFQK